MWIWILLARTRDGGLVYGRDGEDTLVGYTKEGTIVYVHSEAYYRKLSKVEPDQFLYCEVEYDGTKEGKNFIKVWHSMVECLRHGMFSVKEHDAYEHSYVNREDREGDIAKRTVVFEKMKTERAKRQAEKDKAFVLARAEAQAAFDAKYPREAGEASRFGLAKSKVFVKDFGEEDRQAWVKFFGLSPWGCKARRTSPDAWEVTTDSITH